jgi:CDP-glucose 4,6-dehydratase
MGIGTGTVEDMVMNHFGDIYRNKTVLVTGHTGFKGSWLALWLEMLGAKVIGYALKPPSSPNHYELLNQKIISEEGDITDKKRLDTFFEQHDPHIVFHLAAQPIVRCSYNNPSETYNTNVMGTLNVYEACRRTGSAKAIVCVTTDKVYENKERTWGYRENDELGGHDPYSSSKACVELLTTSYRNSFFPLKEFGGGHQTLLATARAGNVIGGGDWGKDRLIPDIMRATAKGESVVIRNPHAVRPWQHVLESLSGYLFLGQKLLEGKKEFACAWNFGPAMKDAVSVQRVVKDVQRNWNAMNYVIQAMTTGKMHEANTLMLDTTKANSLLRWQPVWNYDETIRRTVRWYRRYYEQAATDSTEDIQAYLTMAAGKALPWAGTHDEIYGNISERRVCY